MGSLLKLKDSDCFEQTKRQLIEDHPSYREMIAQAEAESADLFATQSQDLNVALSQSRWDLVESMVSEQEGSSSTPATSTSTKKSPIEVELSR
jgi:hypothetical protein